MKFNIRQSWNKNECVRNKLYSNGIKSTSYVEVPAQNKKNENINNKNKPFTHSAASSVVSVYFAPSKHDCLF